MGTPNDDADRGAAELVRPVQLTRPLAVSIHEVTWGQLDPMDGGQRRCAYERQFHRHLTPRGPAFGVNWFDAVAYCRWLTAQSGGSETDQCYEDPESLPTDAEGNPRHTAFHFNQHGFRLPTEAEWEYVCRSGARTAYGFGSDSNLLADYAWFIDDSIDDSQCWSHPVAQLQPNLRGVFDVHGNLSEWCHDWYEGEWPLDTQVPISANARSCRVNRGGSWSYPAAYCQSALRDRHQPDDRNSILGFRIVAVPPGT